MLAICGTWSKGADCNIIQKSHFSFTYGNHKKNPNSRNGILFLIHATYYMMYKSKIVFSIQFANLAAKTFHVKCLNSLPKKFELGWQLNLSLCGLKYSKRAVSHTSHMPLLVVARAASHRGTGGEGECRVSTGIEVYFWPSPAHQNDTLGQI